MNPAFCGISARRCRSGANRTIVLPALWVAGLGVTHASPAAEPVLIEDGGKIRFRTEEVVTARKDARRIAALAESVRAAGQTRLVVQFDRPVSDADRARLEAAGLTLLNYLGDYAFFARVRAEGIDAGRLAAVPGIQDALAVQRRWKIHPDFADGRVPAWAVVPPAQVDEPHPKKEGGSKPGETPAAPKERMVAAYVIFHRDVPMAPDATNAVWRHQAFIRSRLDFVQGMVIELPESAIPALAGEDGVMWIEPPLPALTELNAENRALTGANIVQAAPYNLNGAGVDVLVYDGGWVRTTHQDFQGRALVGTGEPSCETVATHATHVAGTVGGAGVANANNRGMAPGVNIISYAFQQAGGCNLSQGFLYSDPGDLAIDYERSIMIYGADISNNSIGTNTAPNGYPCTWEGDYGFTDTIIDAIVRGTPGFANNQPFRVVWANGNERQSTRCLGTDGWPSPYHSTAPPACAKNHITVGATYANDDSITSFTSFGPADDGRMKPDVSAPGCQIGGDGGVTSCSGTSDTGYTSACGTSMASPTVCGLSALLLQDFRSGFPTRPDFRNSTLKILLAHTAFDRGNPGPDNQFGYGSVRIQPAVDFMRTGNFLEAEVGQDGSYNVLVVVTPSDTQLKVTLAWDDYPGTVNAIPALVNDLDLVVFDPSNNQRFPWTLSTASPGAPAVQTQRNAVDNLEQVFAANPEPGVWRVEVRGFSVPQGPQPFSLCASPSLINCSRRGVVSLDRAQYPCASVATIQVVDCDLNTDDQTVETVNVTILSTLEPAGEMVTLTESGPETALFRGTIPLSTAAGVPGELQIAHGNTVTVKYLDADDGTGEAVLASATAGVDCVPPVISAVQVSSATAQSATVTFTTDEPATAVVRHGSACGALNNTASGGLRTSHSILLTGLAPSNTYFFAVDATDPAGNSTTDDNGGACHSFQTPDIPDRFTQFFDTEPNDMANRTLLFVPSATLSEYTACGYPIAAFPTDPAGGTNVSLTDDGTATINLTGGQTVKLYGVSYSTVYLNANGNLTFTGPSSTYTQSLANHFLTPRVSGLFRDLNPALGGTISWKQLADRFVATWQNVPTFGQPTTANNLQVEMYFDRRIQISWRTLSATDGISGLSRGQGVPPDFFESDLSSYAACGPLPPIAQGTAVSTLMNAALNVSLPSIDPNDDPLETVITSLPANGRLKDPNGGNILSVPYVLLAGGNVVRYTPLAWFNGSDTFNYKANDGAFDSNIAAAAVTVGGPQTIYSFPMDTNPGWTTMGQWAFGPPQGACSDPSSGYTGTNVYGYNLAGCYPNNLTPTQYLSTPALDCTGISNVQLRFRRWLRVESSTYDRANIQVSGNGTAWTDVWNHSGASLLESSWSLQTYTIAAVADNQPTVYLRWGLGPTDTSVTYGGWNIDDVEIIGQVPTPCFGTTPGDMNFSGGVNGDDAQDFVRVMLDPESATQPERCAADVSLDGSVDPDDVPAFVDLLLGVEPL